MSNKKIEKIYKKKIKLYQKYNKAYYNDSLSLVADSDFDFLKKEILELEIKYSYLISKESPRYTIGFKPAKIFKKIHHKTPMLSLSNAFDKEDIINFKKKY